MPLIPANAQKTAVLDVLRAAVAAGTLELLSASDQVLAIFMLNATAGATANQIWTLGFTSVQTVGLAAAGVGTNATKARMKNNVGTVIHTGLTVVLTSGSGDIKMVNTSITQGQTVEITSATIGYP